MWVSQSYLGPTPGNAHCFVYYLFENYNSEQRGYTEKIEPYLSRLGLALGHRVHLYGPNPIGADLIANEIRAKFGALWWEFASKLPGILVTDVELGKLQPDRHPMIFLSLKDENAVEVMDHLREVLMSKDLADRANRQRNPLRYIREHVRVGLNIGPVAINFV